MKKLKIWNGRTWRNHHFAHAFVCAHSQKHVVELMHKAGDTLFNLNEVRTYWSANCWGSAMEGIKPDEVGVWIQEKDDKKPKRVI